MAPSFRQRLANIGRGTREALKLDDLTSAFQRSLSESTEDARSLLYDFRENQGLGEPPDLTEQMGRSSLMQVLREMASAEPPADRKRKAIKIGGVTLDKNSLGLNELGYSDEMLRARIESGRGIVNDPNFFDRELLKRRASRDAAAIPEILDRVRRYGEDAVLEESPDLKALVQKHPDSADIGNPDWLAKHLPEIDLSDEQKAQALTNAAQKLRQEIGAQSFQTKLGATLGHAAADVLQDRSRSLWWLLNAPQATAATIADALAMSANPNIRSNRAITGEALVRAEKAGLLKRIGDAPLRGKAREDLIKAGVISQSGKVIPESQRAKKLETYTTPQGDVIEIDETPSINGPRSTTLDKYGTSDDDFGGYDSEVGGLTSRDLNPNNYAPAVPGIRKTYDKENQQFYFAQRRLNPSLVGAAAIGATGLATNIGVGLFGSEDTGVPFVGRREGYAAAAPSEEDARKSANAVEEVARRYILSRPGNLLNKDEFLLERPDVSPQQFGQYQAYKYDKGWDLNPFDGDFNIGGVIKGTNEGIHGPEVQFLGQTLSTNEALIPIAGAVGGAVLGGLAPNVRQLRLRRNQAKVPPGERGYGKDQSWIRQALGYTPVVDRKSYNIDADLTNPLIKKGSKLDKATQALENFFMEERNPITQKRDMNVPLTAGVMAAGSGLGLAAGTLLGVGMEDQRRRDNFESWAPPQLDYDQYKQNNRQMLELIKAKEAEMPQAEKDKYKYPSQRSDAVRKDILMDNLQQQQTIIDTLILNERDKRQAERSLEQQRKDLEELNELMTPI